MAQQFRSEERDVMGVSCFAARAKSWPVACIPFHLDIATFVIYYSAKRG